MNERCSEGFPVFIKPSLLRHWHKFFYTTILVGTLPWQCWKSKIQALPQVIGFSPKVHEFSWPISTKSVFRQPAFPWNYPIGPHDHMTLFVGVAVAEPVPVLVTATARFLFPAPQNLL